MLKFLPRFPFVTPLSKQIAQASVDFVWQSKIVKEKDFMKQHKNIEERDKILINNLQSTKFTFFKMIIMSLM